MNKWEEEYSTIYIPSLYLLLFQNPLGEKEEDWLNTLQHWKSKRNSTLERRKVRNNNYCVLFDYLGRLFKHSRTIPPLSPSLSPYLNISLYSYSSPTSIPLSMLSIDTSSSLDSPSLSLLHILLSPVSYSQNMDISLHSPILFSVFLENRPDQLWTQYFNQWNIRETLFCTYIFFNISLHRTSICFAQSDVFRSGFIPWSHKKFTFWFNRKRTRIRSRI